MSETKWTAGPWRVETTAGLDGLPDHHVFSHGRRIAQVNWQSELPSGEREAFSNASLMAAAPELYQALAKWQDVMTKSPQGPRSELIDARETARAALAKARGE